MIDIETAKGIVRALINKKATTGKEKWVIVDSKTYETRSGWVFTWATREWVETGDESAMGIGNMPMLVDRFDGSVHVLKWPQTIEEFAQEYERKKLKTTPQSTDDGNHPAK